MNSTPSSRPPRLLLALAVALLLGPVGAGWAQRDTRAEGYYQTGLALKRDQKYTAALDQFRAALKLDPNYAEAWWGAAWCYVSAGNEEAAIEAFRWVIRLAPETDNGVEAAKAIERIRLRRPDLNELPREPETFLLALSMGREGNADLYLADAEGVVKRRLTTEPGGDGQPAFSGDAHQIIFVSTSSGNQDLWTVKADGTGLRQLTDDPAADYSPTWSPQGNTIVFVSERTGKPALYEVEAAGGETRPLGQTSSRDLEPVWSPEGKTVAFVSDGGGVGKIFVWDAATRVAHQVLANTIPEQHPRWSPDGKYLYFTWSLEGNQQICRVRPNGEGLETVAPSPDNQRLWGVSPGGDLLLSSDRTGAPRLYLRPAGAGPLKVVGQANLEMLFAAISPALPQSVAEILLNSKGPAPTGQ